MAKHDDHDDFGGLQHDLRAMSAMATRRRILKFMGTAALVPLVTRCGSDEGSGSGTTDDGSDSSSSSGSSDTSTTGGTTSTDCTTVPEETAGPYPGDGSNGSGNTRINALTLQGFNRADIRSSVGGVSGTADGVKLTLKLTLLDSSNKCEPLAGYAVYIWHCTRDGQYSMYGLANQNYLRGIQETDENGVVTFTTIFPGCYSGRMPHIHFEVYPSIDSATSYQNKLATSQLAFPDAPCQTVYATADYASSKTNYARITFKTDNVFSEGVSLQLATVSGDVDNGYTAALNVAIEG